MTIRVEPGLSIFDIAAMAYGDASLVYDLITENPGKIDSVISDISGKELTYTLKNTVLKEAIKTPVTPDKVVTIQSTQTLFDLALQHYGAAEKVFELLDKNTSISGLLDTEYYGRVLNYDVKNDLVTNYYLKNNINVSTRHPYYEGPPVINYLKQESGFYLLQENLDKIIIT